MSFFQRVKNILKKPEAPLVEKSILTVGPGDIVEVSFVTYQVVGRTRNPKRNAIMLTLQDGNILRYLKIEEREKTNYELYTPIDGRLDSPDEVPTIIELDDIEYHLEEQYDGKMTAQGKTPFSTDGEQYVWEFQSDNRKLLRIEWQDGRFMLYEGEFIIPADVKVLRGV
ncbi:DUF4178 domain-containing protein [Brevibacillus laterosporus]|uniref:DUF4178 domain-containing protein n=1 Tax=Brevibacillus laterosporus TaxID=1465 RepID=UPI000CE3BEAF|nr:DUF4178 domain-containing protein [Brevibacillus laterosporus]MBG9799604.1 hypothetical protein [Brevibacillus laterosporus]MCR8939337.1 DUF4178 domain-containing protein [Brevibacillus laterosporus]MCZ0841977.1 DUF4178 domain-containing protein [Brevibacillus laterosporus]MCZ0845967.1 DUF4178 domain-containing protein [Brevibacillus laterosporus]MED1909663.1 DUF4178 domain-containing protein [Brevibacillus laterosporus]